MTHSSAPAVPHDCTPAIAADAAARAGLQELLSRYNDETVGLTLTAGRDAPRRHVFTRGGSLSRRAASLIKIPIMCAVFQAIRDDRLAWGQPVRVTSTADGCGILQHVTVPDSLSLRDAMMLMISLSDNRATNAVIDQVGLGQVNDWLERHNYRTTVMRHAMRGLTGQHTSGPTNRTSVDDIARMLNACLHGPDAPQARLLLGSQQINDRLAPATPTGWRVLHKTGELDGLRHDAACFEREDGAWVTAVMMTDGFTDDRGDLSIFGNARLYAQVAEILHAYLQEIPQADGVLASEEGHE